MRHARIARYWLGGSEALSDSVYPCTDDGKRESGERRQGVSAPRCSEVYHANGGRGLQSRTSSHELAALDPSTHSVSSRLLCKLDNSPVTARHLGAGSLGVWAGRLGVWECGT